ncbi:cobamide remodeling phosphodiesterase CbiR [Desulfovibrio legallii]|uniref:Sugar phosphate isomerase/epimerase n=1 Tax=Desulfovibrio legallii TaxID=571438 RepID=A0A1G7IQ10_9BACT|nr:cobamide remodeling phosphodiesterase CbiR [Desulfovibrio legallii]SDF14713.1 hypothetical protein SAMN05192586_10225 [Desulfovibrio legallii]
MSSNRPTPHNGPHGGPDRGPADSPAGGAPAQPEAAPLAVHPLAGRLAAPSFVLPGTVAANARFLAGKVDEVGLCFFEARACLAYGPADLPPALARLPLRWHVHLPVDLPWPARAAGAHPAAPCVALARAVAAKAAYLRPRLAVLHPPDGAPARQRRLLADFAALWQAGGGPPLLVENIDVCDPAALGRGFLPDHNLRLCLDVGHLLGYAQCRLLHSALPEEAELLHWSAPDGGDRHRPLTAFTPEEVRTAAGLMVRAPRTAVHLAEIFQWDGLAASLPVLAALAQGALPGPGTA